MMNETPINAAESQIVKAASYAFDKFLADFAAEGPQKVFVGSDLNTISELDFLLKTYNVFVSTNSKSILNKDLGTLGNAQLPSTKEYFMGLQMAGYVSLSGIKDTDLFFEINKMYRNSLFMPGPLIFSLDKQITKASREVTNKRDIIVNCAPLYFAKGISMAAFKANSSELFTQMMVNNDHIAKRYILR